MCALLSLTCEAALYKDAYVHDQTQDGFSVSSKTLKTLNKNIFTDSDGMAFQEMFVLINMMLPDNDYTIIIEDSSVAQLDVYTGASSVASKQQGTCAFCAIINGVGDGTILADNQQVVALKKRYITPSFLVMPKQHIENIKAICAAPLDFGSLWASMFEFIYKQVGSQSYRLVSNNGGGSKQTVFHMHFHVTPLSVYSSVK